MAGSILAQGDHAGHLWKSLTWAKTTGAGAATLAVLETRNSDGCVAMTITSTSATATNDTSTLATSGHPLRFLSALMSAPSPRCNEHGSEGDDYRGARGSVSSRPPCLRDGWWRPATRGGRGPAPSGWFRPRARRRPIPLAASWLTVHNSSHAAFLS